MRRVSTVVLVTALVTALASCTLPMSADLYAIASRKAEVHVTGITLNATSLPISFSTTAQMSVTITPANATNKAVTWSSSNATLATVSASGLVTAAAAAGTVVITATAKDGGLTASCTFTVSAATVPVAAVALNPPTVTLSAGGTQQLTPVFTPASATNQNVTWSSSNPTAASVSATGLVTAIAATGTVTITVTTQDGGFTGTSTLTLTPAPVAVTGVVVSPLSKSLLPGETVQLAPTISPSTATNQGVTWSTSNSAVATVSATGLVTGLAVGAATITVTTVDGSFTASCAVTVPTFQPPLGGPVASGAADSGVRMALDPTSQAPFIAFVDGSGKGVVEFYNQSAGTWSVVGGAAFATGLTVGGAVNLALAVDSGGLPYVAFEDPSVGNKVTVMECIAGTWFTVGAPGFSTGAANWLSLAVDGTTPYVSFVDNGASDKVTIMSFNGTSWAPVGLPAFSNASSAYTSLSIRSGTAYVAYGNGASLVPEVAANNAIVGGLFTSNGCFFPSLAIDQNNGDFYIAYEDPAASDFLSAWKYNGVSWSSIGTGISPNQAGFPNVAVAPDSSAYAVFQDIPTGKATVMKYNGTAWTVAFAAFTAGIANDLTAEFDAAGHLFICYDTNGTISVQELQ